MKKKILIISQPEIIDTVGGAITIFLNFSQMLVQQGYEVCTCCYTEKKGSPNFIEKVNFVNLYYYNGDKNNFSNKINLFLQEYKPDLLIFFFPYLYLSADLELKFNTIPKILMLHSRPDLYFSLMSEEMINKIKTNYNNTITQILFEDFYSLLPDFIQTKPLCIIPNPVTLQKNTINTNIEHKQIIYLSRIDYWKNVEFIIDVFHKVHESYKDWKLHIYGESQPPEYVSYLKKLIKLKNLENTISFMGITNEPLKTFLNYDFCVFPSLLEGFGLGLSEAMSVGLPAIGLKKSSGVNELIIENYNGYLCDDNVDDFAEKINILIKDKKLRSQMSKNAKQSVERFNSDEINKKWLSLIEKILTSGIKNEICANNITNNKQFFSISKILQIKNERELEIKKNMEKISFLQKIFSITNQDYKKIIRILGIKISIKRK